jgi:hypothetical protein
LYFANVWIKPIPHPSHVTGYKQKLQTEFRIVHPAIFVPIARLAADVFLGRFNQVMAFSLSSHGFPDCGRECPPSLNGEADKYSYPKCSHIVPIHFLLLISFISKYFSG